MTTYTIEVNSVEAIFTSLRFEEGVGNDPDTWEAILSNPATSITMGHSVNIKRDGTTTFSGIVEVIEPQYGNATSKKISGRHNKVKLWRKWNERYSEAGGFWTSYYPNKIVSFLMRPSFSTYDEDDYLTKIGWGLSPAAWTITSVKAATGSNDLDASHSATNLKSRLSTIGFRSLTDQTQNDYIQIDLGSSTSIVGIRLTNRTLQLEEYIRNYKIEGSVTGAWGGEEITLTATVSDNRAINIVESWAAQSVQYIRIYCTTSFADKWSASDVYIYENDTAITGISEGTLTEHLPLNCSLMTGNAASSQANIAVQEGWRFRGRIGSIADSGDKVIIMDDNGEEYGIVESVSGNTITLDDNLTGSYTTAANALVLNYSRESEFNIEYSRRSDSINKVVKTCTDTSNNPWVWGVTNAGAVSMGPQIGSDVSGSVSFVEGTSLYTGAARTDARKTVDRVMVVGRGKDDAQDRTASGWQGSGDYEHISVDTKLESQEATKSKGQELLQLNTSGVQTESLLVDDSAHATNAWGVDDDITLTSATLGLSGSYRVKKVSRRYDINGEKVTIQTTRERPTTASMMAKILKDAMESKLVTGDRPIETFDGITNNPAVSLYYDATTLTLDDDVIIEDDVNSTNNKHIKMAQAESGVVLSGPGATMSSGRYEVRFYLKVTSNASSSSLVTLDVYSTSLGSTFNTRTIAPDDFTTSNTWQVISLFFELTVDYFDVEFRINSFQTGITDLYCDWIGIVPTVSAPGAIDSSILEIELRPWNSNLSVIWDDVDDTPPTDFNHILWGAPGAEGSGGTDATITFTDGATQTITANVDTSVGDGVWWIYWTDANSVLQWTQTYSAAVGSGKGLLGIVDINAASSEAPSIILFNAYTPTIGTGILAAYSIIAKHIVAGTITADKLSFTAYIIGTNNLDDVIDGSSYARVLNTDITAGHVLLSATTGDLDDVGDGTTYGKVAVTDITAGKIKLTTQQDMGSQGFEVVSGTGTERIEMTSTHIAGYNTSVLQFELKASDGKGYFGAGAVVADINGLTVDGDGLVTFKDGSGNTVGVIGGQAALIGIVGATDSAVYFASSGTGDAQLQSLGSGNTLIDSAASIYLTAPDIKLVGDVDLANYTISVDNTGSTSNRLVQTDTGNLGVWMIDSLRDVIIYGANSGSGGVLGPNLKLVGDAATSVPAIALYNNEAATRTHLGSFLGDDANVNTYAFPSTYNLAYLTYDFTTDGVGARMWLGPGTGTVKVYENSATDWANIANTTISNVTVGSPNPDAPVTGSTHLLKIVVAGGAGSFQYDYGVGGTDWSEKIGIAFWWYGETTNTFKIVIVDTSGVTMTKTFVDIVSAWGGREMFYTGFIEAGGTFDWTNVRYVRFTELTVDKTYYMDRLWTGEGSITQFWNTRWFRVYKDEGNIESFAIDVKLGTVYVHGPIDINPFDTFTGGTLLTLDLSSPIVLDQTLSGLILNFDTNVTATNQNVDGYTMTLPSVINTGAAGYTIKGMTVVQNAITHNTGAGNTQFTGIDINLAQITQTAPATLVQSIGVDVAMSGCVTAGTSYGIHVAGGVSTNFTDYAGVYVVMNNASDIAFKISNGAFQMLSTAKIQLFDTDEYIYSTGSDIRFGIGGNTHFFMNATAIGPITTKTETLGVAGNRWGASFIASNTAGTSRTIKSKITCKDHPGVYCIRTTGGYTQAGYNWDYQTVFCPICGNTYVVKIDYLPTELKNDIPDFDVMKIRDMKYTQHGAYGMMIEVHYDWTLNGELYQNATYIEDNELDDFNQMTEEERKAYLNKIGKQEWNSHIRQIRMEKYIKELNSELSIFQGMEIK